MIAIYLDAQLNVSANLKWLDSYLYPKKDLNDALDRLRTEGYHISLFPEGDGITFSHPSHDNRKMYSDFCTQLPWMDIYTREQCETADFSTVLEETVIVFMPMPRFMIDQPFFSKNNTIFPAGYLEMDKLDILNFNGSRFSEFSQTTSWPNINDPLNHFTGITTEEYRHLPTLVFKMRLPKYEVFINQEHRAVTESLGRITESTQLFMDHLKYRHSNYKLLDNVVERPGILGNYSSAVLHFIGVNKTHIINRQLAGRILSKGLGLYVDALDVFYDNPLIHGDTGEVGQVLKYALRLHSGIIENDDHNLKFAQIMTLFEYLADPDHYLAAKKVKGKIAVFNARNRTEYNTFCERYRVLSEDYRTSIVHLGKRLEDIVPEGDLENLFTELHRYVLNVMERMFYDMFLTWQEFAEKRDARQIELSS